MTEQEKTQLIECDQRSKSSSHRLDDLRREFSEFREENKAIYKIATSVEVMATKLGVIEGKVDETCRKVDETSYAQRESEDRLLRKVTEIENKPARQTAQNVNSIKVAVITAAITFVVSGVLGTILFFFEN